jgi:hypothetical protein
MTDNQGLMSNSVGLDDSLLYNLKPNSGNGKSYRVSVTPTNKSIFAPSDQAILYIPAGRKGTFLDPQQSYIKYTIWNNDISNNIIDSLVPVQPDHVLIKPARSKICERARNG